MKLPLLALVCTLPITAAELPSIDAMTSAAEGFLGTLDAAKREKAAFAFDSDQRENFRFTPQTRTGLPLGDMSDAQRAAAMKLLEAALSEKGKLKVEQIRTLEAFLGVKENRPDYRNPQNYFVSIFGKPGDEKGWGWKFEGHHVSLNYTMAGEGKFSVTPSFYGANPGEVREGEHKGLRVLKEEDELAKKLLALLLEGEKKAVLFTTLPPAEIITAESRKVTATEPVGVAAADMNGAQKKALFELISAYTGRHRSDLAEADMEKIVAAGVDKIHFGWAGGTKRGEAWYYRVQGPTFIMEAANTQNDANHVHAAWRDFDGDFGRDILAEHYQQHEKDHGDH
ncbi:DUF3500 domain-containing protein [Luteolibacter marinus]|uniref:DUF3500 domain-containing protein n=1 Tax=Luteolibacter marinus TaxID=2776705 RepID=UPI00186879F4|nr:DUF3500 domain-containing protein [Luteolibacter marinus]